MFLYNLQIFILSVLIGSSYCQDTCTTPDGKYGVCKLYSHCPSIFDIMRGKNLTTEQTDFVRKSVCGYQQICWHTMSGGCVLGAAALVGGSTRWTDDPVCCNDCYTPDGNVGSCVPPNQCPHLGLLHRSKSRPEYIANSICRYDKIHVCCGPPPSPVVRHKCNTRMSAFPLEVSTECCGIDSHFVTKITGGNATDIYEYPWLVNLEYDMGNTIEVKCGGSLISGKYVVTAAHCVVGRLRRSLVSVRLGEYDLEHPGQDCTDKNYCNDNPESVPIEEIIPHPDYNNSTFTNDIAVLRLSRLVNYTDFIRPICLPWSDISSDPKFNEYRAYAAGWGQTSEDNPRNSRFKQDVELPLVNLVACSTIINTRTNKPWTLWDNQICAGGEIGKDSCKGDSGGPLMVRRRHDGTMKMTYELTGIVSYGVGRNQCGRAVPAVYTNVFPYKFWIRSQIRP